MQQRVPLAQIGNHMGCPDLVEERLAHCVTRTRFPLPE